MLRRKEGHSLSRRHRRLGCGRGLSSFPIPFS